MFKRWLGEAFLRVAGWKIDGERPTEPRYVIIAAPHTSNWDMPFMLAMAFVFDIPVRWMGKHTLFKPPFGAFFRRVGGMPIVRHRAGGVVDQMIEHFEDEPALVLMVPAEGTRAHVDYWKSGFYRIALAANVPVCLSYLDFGKKIGGIGPMIELSGDVRADMDKVRAFYEGKQGFFPENVGRIRLREEDVEALVGGDVDEREVVDRLVGNL